MFAKLNCTHIKANFTLFASFTKQFSNDRYLCLIVTYQASHFPEIEFGRYAIIISKTVWLPRYTVRCIVQLSRSENLSCRLLLTNFALEAIDDIRVTYHSLSIFPQRVSLVS